MNVHFSSATDLHATPQEFFAKLNAEFGFTLDVCATSENAKCKRYYTKQDDGLAQPMYFRRSAVNVMIEKLKSYNKGTII